MAEDLPLIMTTEGPQLTPPATLRAELVDSVGATNPGYTANLPASLIEDVADTQVFGLALIDAARVETVNDVTPFGANAFVLNQLGQQAGVPLNEETNTSVNVVFSGPPGFVIAQGFTVSDGTYQYALKTGGVIGAGGDSAALFAIATITGSWTVAPNTVTQLVTSVPLQFAGQITCFNPIAGTPGGPDETEESYRARVIEANLAPAQGFGTTLRTEVGKVSGVSQRLISTRQQSGGGWQIIVGGGDPYEVAYAIYFALFDISTLVGSDIDVIAITKANPGVVTTELNHNLTDGAVEQIHGVVGMTPINGIDLTITVIDETNFSVGVDTTGFPDYVSGGVVTPNPIDQLVSLQDYPDTYTVPFVTPAAQAVTVTVTWNTTSPNFVSASAVEQLGSPALVDYVNAVVVGQPMNLFTLQSVFRDAIATVLAPNLLTRMVFAIAINGQGVDPEAGTGIIAGDPVSYFQTDSTLITILQG